LKETCWEQRKNEKIPAPKLKRKKSRHFECMLSLPIGCMKFLFPKHLGIITRAPSRIISPNVFNIFGYDPSRAGTNL
jgi:hypothetical protein